jgi:hypothetical protein
MARIIGSLATALLPALFVVGCAMSSPADLTPDVDPNLPGVDAGHDPHAVPGSHEEGTPVEAGAAADASTGESDSGKKAIAPDGAPPPITKPGAGEVLITEVMYATVGPEPASEWFELYNAATSPRTLGGLVLKDGGGRTHLISAAVTIPPGGYVVFARSKTGAIAAKVPASVIAYEYGTGLSDASGILLANGSTGGISLLNGAVTVASAPYGGWFTGMGASIQLKALDASQTTAKAGWCRSSNAWTSGSENGTPGLAGDCP